MSYSFGSKSRERLQELHPDLQAVLKNAIHIVDFSIICGYRGPEEQNKAYRAGRSKLQYPQSKHNRKPSLAVDIAPFPIHWGNERRFDFVAGICLGLAKSMGIRLRYGGDWDMDGELLNNNFNDLPHLELYGEKYDHPG